MNKKITYKAVFTIVDLKELIISTNNFDQWELLYSFGTYENKYLQGVYPSLEEAKYWGDKIAEGFGGSVKWFKSDYMSLGNYAIKPIQQHQKEGSDIVKNKIF